MGDLSTLHSQAKKLCQQIDQGLHELEAVEGGSRHGDLPSLALTVRSQLADLQRVSQDLEGLSRVYVARERDPAKRTIWKGKVESIVADVAGFRRALDKYGSREDRRAAERAAREELFQRADEGRRAKTEMDLEAEMTGSIGRSKKVLQEMFETGGNVLTSMAANRERLKAAQRKALDVLNSVGLGETLLKLIERRQRMDIWLTYGGMVVMLLVVVLLIWIFWF